MLFEIVKTRLKSTLKTHQPVAHGGLYGPKYTSSKFLDFSSNISPVNTPKSIRNTIKKQIEKISSYPDPCSSKLLTELEKYTKIPSSNLIVGNGAIEIIYNFCNAFLSKNTPVLIPIPTFAEYEVASKLNNCKIDFFKTMDLTENYCEFISIIPKNGCVFICNPNNPTGKLISKNNLLEIVNKANRQNSFVFVDECFIELVPRSKNYKIIKIFDI